MAFSDWEGFQKLAKVLVAKNDEAMLRSAINRSYYAAFQISLCFLESFYSFVKNRNGTDHERVIVEMRSKNSTTKKIGDDLWRLKDNRRKADYVETISINQKDAEFSVLLGDKIIQNLKNYK